jgi:hypothetical protein
MPLAPCINSQNREGKSLFICVIKELNVIHWTIFIKIVVGGKAGRARHNRILPCL